MQLEIISLSQINPAGDSDHLFPLSGNDLSPLIVVKDISVSFTRYQLAPGQDKRLEYMKLIGLKETPCFLLPGELPADCLVGMSILISKCGRGGLIEMALQLIPCLALNYQIKVDKVNPIPADFDIRGSHKLELTTDTDDTFTLAWCEDMGGNEWCDLFGIAKYILYSHPDHPLKDKLYGLGTADPFFAINIRNDYSCMFWDTQTDWAKELDRRELEQKI